jgi:hypothetical protein
MKKITAFDALTEKQAETLKRQDWVRPWVHPTSGETRYYISLEDSPSVNIEYYGSGNVKSFGAGGKGFANSRAGSFVGQKMWVTDNGSLFIKASDRAELINPVYVEWLKKYLDEQEKVEEKPTLTRGQTIQKIAGDIHKTLAEQGAWNDFKINPDTYILPIVEALKKTK